MTVLVLAEDLNPTADQVVGDLDELGVPVFRCDTAWFPQQLSLHARPQDHHWAGLLRTPHREVELEDLRSVWYRSPTAFRFPPEMSSVERRHAEREARLGLGGVLASLPLPIINHPGREADAVYKPAQLVTARRCGLSVPATVITNDPDVVHEFTTGRQTVIKVLGANVVYEDGARKFAATHVLTSDDLSDLRGLELTSHLVQEWVDKDHEARVVVVGDRMFAVAIDAGSDATFVDWRVDYEVLSYRVIAVPITVADGISAYMASFGISYAAFDFVITPAQEWFFLEANPGGQFGWLQAATGLPISSALAALLAKGGSL